VEDGRPKVQKDIRTLAGEVENQLCNDRSNLRLERSAMGNIIGILALYFGKVQGVGYCTVTHGKLLPVACKTTGLRDLRPENFSLQIYCQKHLTDDGR
jgi:hypothetical protein